MASLAPRSPWHRVLKVGLLLFAIGAGLFVTRWAAMKCVFYYDPLPTFADARLQRGLTWDEVVQALGPPSEHLQDSTARVVPGQETVRYRRGEVELTLTFQDGTLENWTESGPIDLHATQHVPLEAVKTELPRSEATRERDADM